MITGARNKKTHGVFITFLSFVLLFISGACAKFEKVGVLFIVHGGMDTMQTQFVWDTAMQQFSYDPNHPANGVIHNAALWNAVLQQEVAKKYRLKYDFEYARIGGTDPFREISLRQLGAMKEELAKLGAGARLRFEVDWAAWMCGDCIEHYPYPRYMYYPPSGQGDKCTYCGEQESDGPWSGCDPDRYNVDGPVERLLKKGVSRIIAIDLTVGGVRFSKTFDVIELSKRVINQWNTQHNTSVSLVWVNDYKNLMERSYPLAPAGWTMSKGLPTEDAHVPLEGNPNPLQKILILPRCMWRALRLIFPLRLILRTPELFCSIMRCMTTTKCSIPKLMIPSLLIRTSNPCSARNILISMPTILLAPIRALKT